MLYKDFEQFGGIEMLFLIVSTKEMLTHVSRFQYFSSREEGKTRMCYKKRVLNKPDA